LANCSMDSADSLQTRLSGSKDPENCAPEHSFHAGRGRAGLPGTG
jgi:hypothetical protein